MGKRRSSMRRSSIEGQKKSKLNQENVEKEEIKNTDDESPDTESLVLDDAVESEHSNNEEKDNITEDVDQPIIAIDETIDEKTEEVHAEEEENVEIINPVIIEDDEYPSEAAADKKTIEHEVDEEVEEEDVIAIVDEDDGHEDEGDMELKHNESCKSDIEIQKCEGEEIEQKDDTLNDADLQTSPAPVICNIDESISDEVEIINEESNESEITKMESDTSEEAVEELSTVEHVQDYLENVDQISSDVSAIDHTNNESEIDDGNRSVSIVEPECGIEFKNSENNEGTVEHAQDYLENVDQISSDVPAIDHTNNESEIDDGNRSDNINNESVSIVEPVCSTEFKNSENNEGEMMEIHNEGVEDIGDKNISEVLENVEHKNEKFVSIEVCENIEDKIENTFSSEVSKNDNDQGENGNNTTIHESVNMVDLSDFDATDSQLCESVEKTTQDRTMESEKENIVLRSGSEVMKDVMRDLADMNRLIVRAKTQLNSTKARLNACWKSVSK